MLFTNGSFQRNINQFLDVTDINDSLRNSTWHSDTDSSDLRGLVYDLINESKDHIKVHSIIFLISFLDCLSCLVSNCKSERMGPKSSSDNNAGNKRKIIIIPVHSRRTATT
ncbi:hypothetical protein D3C71_1754250 [compost metagenome]